MRNEIEQEFVVIFDENRLEMGRIPKDLLSLPAWHWILEPQRHKAREFLLYLWDINKLPEESGYDDVMDFADTLKCAGKTPESASSYAVAAKQLLFRVLEPDTYNANFKKNHSKNSIRKETRNETIHIDEQLLFDIGFPHEMHAEALSAKRNKTRSFAEFLIDRNANLKTMKFNEFNEFIDDYEMLLIERDMSANAINNYLKRARSVVNCVKTPRKSQLCSQNRRREPFKLPGFETIDPKDMEFPLYDFLTFLGKSEIAFNEAVNANTIRQYRKKLVGELLSPNTIDFRITRVRKALRERFGINIPKLQPETVSSRLISQKNTFVYR